MAGGKDPGADKQAERDKAEKAKQAGKNTVNAVLDLFIARHVEKNLRSASTVKRSWMCMSAPGSVPSRFTT